MACLLTVRNIQKRQTGDTWMLQTALVQFQHYLIKMIGGRNLVYYHTDSFEN